MQSLPFRGRAGAPLCPHAVTAGAKESSLSNRQAGQSTVSRIKPASGLWYGGTISRRWAEKTVDSGTFFVMRRCGLTPQYCPVGWGRFYGQMTTLNRRAP
jgi:hypothetical protein